MNKRHTLATLAGLCMSALAASAGAQTKWDLPNAYSASTFHTENLVQFAKDVDAATGGKLKIQVHDNASLFKAPEIKRAVQGNQAQAGEFLMVNFQNEWPLWGLDGLPFLATSYADSLKLYQASKAAVQKKLAEQGMLLLYTVAWQPQGIYSKKQVNSAADMKGMKWRAYSPATARIGELVGAQPVTIQQAELSQAMATGVVEAFMTSSSTGYDTKTFEHLKFFADVQAWLPKNAVVANKKAFDALDKATQDGLLKAAAEAEKRGWATSEKKNAEYLDLLKKNGMTVYAPSAQLKADMQKVGETMLKEWLDKAGTDGKVVVDAYRK
ncbi:MAG: TRAP transporter substrate-binding protein [Pseudomonadota bacterium]|nr:TRAP transporter substrate-binding protein [Pseudomonadota bacterium]